MAKKRKLSKSSLLWFLRSRPFVPVAEIRRRFGLEAVDEIGIIHGREGKIYVGLPSRVARLLEELWRENRIDLVLSLDLHARVLIGVYALHLREERTGVPQPVEGLPPDEYEEAAS